MFHRQLLTPDDAPRLQQLMFRIYPAAYAYLWDDGGQWYVENIYEPAALREELSDPRAATWFVYLDGATAPAGFYKTMRGKGPEGPDDRYFYLHRLYLGPEARGRGIGTRLVRDSLAQARAAGFRRAWLETMDSGPAGDFYRSFGFRQTGSIQLPFPGIRPGLRTLLTLEKDLY
jgi:ribosomal protein S18 acetylase RimI-like enzyme